LSNFLSLFKNTLFQFLDRIGHIHLSFFSGMFQLFNLINQIFNWFFKIKELSVFVFRHR